MEKIDELRRALEGDPNNAQLRKDLVKELLDADETEEASATLKPLLESQQNDPEALDLALRNATALGDRLLVERLKRQMRIATTEEDDDDDIDMDEWEEDAQSSWEVEQPRLRLLPGGINSIDFQHSLFRNTRHNLDDIAGLETIKRNLLEIIESIRNPPETGWLGGTFFYGPPSCGKSFLGEVIATELGAAMWYFDLSETWSVDELVEAIQQATTQAQKGPVLLYLQNLDRDIHEDGTRQSVISNESVLSALDNARKTGTVVIVGAATVPWVVSTKVVRPGRLGRVLLVLPPDAPSRRQFLSNRLHGKVAMDPMDIDWMVRHTDGYSFGDLQHLVDVAFSMADTSLPMPTLSHEVIRKARQQTQATSADWLTTAGHHAIMNESGGLYDDLLDYFRARQKT